MSWLDTIARFKSSPRVWALVAPVLLAVTTHFAHQQGWFLPLLAYVLFAVLPSKYPPNAQRIHFLIGFLCVSLRWWAVFVVIPIVLFIEVWYDPRYEHDPWLPDGLVDMSSYVAGVMLGLL